MRQLRNTSTKMPRRKTADSLKPAPVDRSARPANFLDLPAEIRNTIYELVFMDLTIVYPKPTPSNTKGRANYPRVLMASRQIYHESTLLYYSTVSLHFEVTDRMLSVLRKLGAQKRALLTNVFFVSDSVALVPSPQDIIRLRSCAETQLTILQRRLRDFGATLKPGVLKIIVLCWWCQETEERAYLCWLDEEDTWCCVTVEKLDEELIPGSTILV